MVADALQILDDPVSYTHLAKLNTKMGIGLKTLTDKSTTPMPLPCVSISARLRVDLSVRVLSPMPIFVFSFATVSYTHLLGHAVADGCLEGVLDLVLDDKDHGLKACAVGIVQGVLHNGLPRCV